MGIGVTARWTIGRGLRQTSSTKEEWGVLREVKTQTRRRIEGFLDNPVSVPVVRPEVNTGAQSWRLTPGRSQWLCDPEGAQWFFPLHLLLSLPSPQFIFEIDHSSRNKVTEQSCGSVCAAGDLNYLHRVLFNIYIFRQTVQWSMILESSMSNGVVCWTESSTLVISSIKLTTRWMFCKTKLITCELTTSKTNRCSVVIC